MIDVRKEKSPNLSIGYIDRYVIFFVLLASSLSALFLFPGNVIHSSSTWTRSGKSPLSSSNYANNPAPKATISRYITPKEINSLTKFTNYGCSQAKAVIGGVAILDFGETVDQSGVYGTFLPGTSSPFVSDSTIQSLAEQYLSGYWSCDTQPSGTNFILGIGTDNGGPYMTSVTNAASAGQEWGTMIASIKSWLITQGYTTRLKIFGASNMLLENNTAVITRAWADGFGTVYNSDGVSYIDYGDATGCPVIDNATNQPCSNGWTQNDIAYVSWVENAAYPLPQIYDRAGSEALQWQSIEYYQRSNPSLGYPMFIQGSTTQYEACLQKGGCQGTNNAPSGGWNQLYTALQSSSVTAQPRLWDATDFQWDT